MPETKNDYMMLAVHTDKEFTQWLQRHAEDNWWLKENRGNTFVFSKKPWDGKRICSYTVRSDVLGVSAEDVFYEKIRDLRKSGWELLAMGAPENLTDRTRHAFLAEEPREDLPHPEIPLSEPEGQRMLLRAALKKAVSTAALCLIYAAVLIYFIILKPNLLFTGTGGMIFLGLTAVIWLICMFFSAKSTILYAKAVRDPETDSAAGDYLALDRAVLLSFAMLGILAVHMLSDMFL